MCHVLKAQYCLGLSCVSASMCSVHGVIGALEHLSHIWVMDFQDRDPHILHYVLHTLTKLLEFLCQRAHNVGNMNGVRLEHFRRGLHLFVGVEVNVVGEGGELSVQCLNQVLHSFG